MKRETEKRKGSATIEAVLCLTIFMVAIMTILSFINICRAQAAVSYAVDAAAKEMSQYAYFYHICGLEERQKTTIDKTAKTREDMNNIVGGTEALFMVFDSIKNNDASSEDIENFLNNTIDVINPTGEGKSEEDTGTKITMGNAASKINDMTTTLTSIDNPMAFLKNMVTVGGMEATSYLRSQLIAAPMAKALMKKHFEVDGMGADDYLRSLRIGSKEVDGMEALNLQMSTIFDPTAPDDIHLVCYYEVKPAQFFNFDFGTVVLCKESVTRAWLSGDREYTNKEEKKEESGIWDMPSTKYGKYIVGKEREDLVKKGCYDISGSGADAFNKDENTVYHIRSMDIYSDTYQNVDAVKNTLMKEYEMLASAAESAGDSTIRVKEKGETKEIASDKDSRKLHIIIVVPEGTEPQAFQDGLKAAFGDLKKEGKLTYEVKHGYGASTKDPKEESETPKEEENP